MLPVACQVQRGQLPQRVVLGNAGIPPIGRRHCRIKGRVGVVKPLRAGVVEVGQGTLLQRLLRRLVARDRSPET